MILIETETQAAEISANDLRAEALAALARGDKPGYGRTQISSASYTGRSEVVVTGLRGGWATNGSAQWGDVQHDDEHGQVLALDAGGRVTLDGAEI